MSDYFAAAISIGGPVPMNLKDELLELIRDNHLVISEKEIEFAIKTGVPITLSDNEAIYGAFDDLEYFLRENGIPFIRETNAFADWDGEIVYSSPKLELDYNALQDGKPVIELDDIAKICEIAEAALLISSSDDVLKKLLKDLREYTTPIPSLTPFSWIDTDDTVSCCFCSESCGKEAHLYQDKWVCDNCWDVRLKSSQ